MITIFILIRVIHITFSFFQVPFFHLSNEQLFVYFYHASQCISCADYNLYWFPLFSSIVKKREYNLKQYAVQTSHNLTERGYIQMSGLWAIKNVQSHGMCTLLFD